MNNKYYEYQVINISLEPRPGNDPTGRAAIETAANRWAALGWRTVAVMPSRGPSYADSILIERKKDDSNKIREEMRRKAIND